MTGAECYNCGWMVSDRFSYCPWCGADIYEEGYSSEEPLKAPKGFRMDARCDWGCGGGVQYPMRYCPWCGRRQSWNEDDLFEGECPHCARGVDDWMNACPWCGGDPTGRDLIPRALTRVRRLLLVSRIRDWGYRVLLRPGVSGVDPRYPKIVEIEQRYVVGKQRQDEIPWTMLVGLLTHELGHSFLYHHWDWTRTRRFRRAFGEVDKAYRGMDNTWVYFQRRAHRDRSARPRQRLRGQASAGGFRRDLPLLRHPPRPAAGSVRRVRPEAEGCDSVREVSGAARLRAGAAGLGVRDGATAGRRTMPSPLRDDIYRRSSLCLRPSAPPSPRSAR